MIATWIWAHSVQNLLDHYLVEHNAHRIRKQKKINLPSGASHNDLYDFPENYGMTDLLIPMDQDTIDMLVEEYCPRDVFQFLPDEKEAIMQGLHERAGTPALTIRTAWDVFQTMLSFL